MVIRTLNNLTVDAQVTYVAQNTTAGTNAIPWRNPNGFTAGYAVQIGNSGDSQSETLLLGTPVNGTIGTFTANTFYDHPADTPMYLTKYDQVVFCRSLTGTTGTSSPITNGTVTLQANGTQTAFDDTSGLSTYGYQTYFQNSGNTSIQSFLSDWITIAGFPWYSLGKIRQRIMDKLVSSGYINGVNISDTMINDWINEWLETMTNAIADVNQDYQMGTMSIGFQGTTQLGTITNTDFKGGLRRVWYFDGAGTYMATKMDSNSFSPNKIFVSTYPYYFFQGDTVIGRQPFDQSGTFICEYYNSNPVLVEDTDQLPQTMQNYTTSFVAYGHAQALFKDQKIQEATAKLGEAQAALAKFVIQKTPRNMDGQDYIDIVESTGGDDNLWLNL